MAGLTQEQLDSLAGLTAPASPPVQFDMRRNPAESVSAYRARLLDAISKGPAALPSGAQEMNTLAQFALAEAMPPVPPPEPSWQNTAVDMAKAGAAGLSRGTTGMIDLAMGALPTEMARTLYRTGATAFSGGGLMDVLSASMPAPYTTDAARELTGGATDFQGQTTQGQYAGTIGEFLPSSIVPGGSVKNALMFGVVPAVASEWAGQATEGTAAEPYARMGAAMVSPVLAQAVVNPSSILRTMYGNVTPTPERQAAAGLLASEGIPMTAGQAVGNEDILRREMMTRRGSQIVDVAQPEAFTRSILRTIGEDAPRATPRVLDDADIRLGKAFDEVAQGIDIIPDPAMATQADDIARVYNRTVEVGSKVSGITEIADEIVNAVTNPTGSGALSSRLVMNWRSELGPLVRSNSDATRTAARELREMLEDSIEAQLIAAGRPDDIARWAEARAQYRNFLIVENAATRAGAATQEGLLSPAQIRSALVGQDRRAYATGRRGDIAEVARAGETVMRRPPNSGTPAGIAEQGMPAFAAGSFGATIGSLLGGTPGAMVGATVAPFIKPVYRSIGMTGPAQRAIVNGGPSLLGPNNLRPLNGLLAQ